MAKKKKAEEKFELKYTSLYEKTERSLNEQESLKLKKAKRKKIAIGVAAAIIVLLVVVPLIVVNVISTPQKEMQNDGIARFTYEQLLESVTATEKSTELYNMKNPDITEHKKVEELIAKLQISSELGDYKAEVQSAEKPYTVTLKFESSHEIGDDGEDEWQTSVIKYSCAIMSLIDNIAQVHWEYPTEAGKTDGSYFTRADAEKLMSLGVPVTRFAESEAAVQLLLNQLGIDLY